VLHLYHLGPDLVVHRMAAAGLPCVLTLHGPIAPSVVPALDAAEAVAACSEAVLNDTVARFPAVADRVRLVRNALPPAGRKAGPVPSGPPVVLFVGRVVPQKGFDLGLTAFARLRQVRPDARLVVVGDGVETMALAAQVDGLDVADAVELVG
jgi:glycosyltransferase involved in cell wall biosynthesis